jgi:splicing factor 3B subunit 5
MADKLRTIQNLEALQSRYIGTGHADTTKYEWTSNILRDSYSSYVGHPPLLSYMAVGMGEPKEMVRAAMLEKMVRGAGNPPEVCGEGVQKSGLETDILSRSRLKSKPLNHGSILIFLIPPFYISLEQTLRCSDHHCPAILRLVTLLVLQILTLATCRSRQLHIVAVD